MDHERFRDWFSRVDELTAAQRKEVAAVLSDPPEGAASLAAIELGVDDERRCPHCGAGGAVSRGKARGLRRFRCKECGRTFAALTGTALSGLHRKERWLAFGASLAEGETIKGSAARCGRDCAEHGASLAPPLSGSGAPGCRTGLPGSSRQTRRSSLRAGRASGSWSASRAGAAARPASAASRASRCRSWSLPTVPARPQPYPAGAEHRQREGGAGAGPRPGCAARLRRQPLLSARRGGARHPSREHRRLGWRAGPGRGAHPDGQQPPQPDQGLPARAARHRHEVPRQLSEAVPSHRTRRPAFAQGLP